MDTKAPPSSDRHDEQPMSIQRANRKEINVSLKKGEHFENEFLI